MPKYVIEREIPGIGGWSVEQIQKTAEKSRAVLRELGPDIQWLTSYVAADKLSRTCGAWPRRRPT